MTRRLALVLLTIAAAAMSVLALASSAQASRAYDSSFGTFTANNGSNPQSLAVDQQNGDVYAVDIDNSTVRRFDSAGTPKNFTCAGCTDNTLAGLTLDYGPGDNQVAVDRSGGPADGNIYVADSVTGLVQVFDNDGTSLGSLDGSGTPDGFFAFGVFGVAVDQQNGDLYVSTGFGSHVWRYAPSADLVIEADFEDGITTPGPTGNISVAFGKVYVTPPFSPGNVEVYKRADFAPGGPSATGTVLTNATQTTSVDPSNGDLYADKVDHVDVYDAAGQLRFTFGSSAEFGSSAGVAVKGSGGPAYVADGVGNEIDVYIQPSASRAYDSSFGTFTANNGSNPQSLAVDQQNGDVYAVDIDNSTVRRFDSAGTPKNFTCAGCTDNTLAGLTLDYGPGDNQVAVDRSGGPADGNIYVADSVTGLVQVFDNDGTSLGSLDGSGTPDGFFAFGVFGVAVDQQNGDLYVSTGFGSHVWRYAPSADLVIEADFEDGITTPGPTGNISVAFGKVYVTPPFSPGNVEVYKRADFAPGGPSATGTVLTNATQTTSVDPSNGDLYADKVDHVDVYDAAGQLRFTFGSSAEFGSSAGVAVKGSGGPAYVADGVGNEIDRYSPVTFGRTLTVTKNGPGSGTVTSDPAGIACGPSCEFLQPGGTEVTLTAAPDSGSRLKSWSGCDSVAGNECTLILDADTEVTATFSAKPTVVDLKASQVTQNGARLSATVDPNLESTSSHFEYVTEAQFQVDGFASASSTPDQSAGPGDDPVSVNRSITGLHPGTAYRFRMVATNTAGETESPDSSFATYGTPPDFSADDCDNDQFRVGPSAKLPDCRAYEQATPRDKNGIDAVGRPGYAQAAFSGDAVTFLALAGLPGSQGAQDYGVFLSSRGDQDWSTTSLLPPASYGSFAEVQGWTPSLETTFSNSRAYFGAPDSTLLFNAHSAADDTIASIPGGGTFADASADDDLVYFQRGGDLHVWDLGGDGDVVPVGVLPDSACASPPPCMSAAGTSLGADRQYAYSADDGAVSESGDRAYFTDRDDGQLYLRQDPTGDEPETKHVSASHKTNGAGLGGTDFIGPLPARFHTASADGSKAIFSSSEELTNDANTGPNHIPAIGRADIADGGNPDPTLIAPQTAKGIAVDDTHLYWADPDHDSIGRAELDGDNPDPDFITGADDPQYVALDQVNDRIYWTNAADFVDFHDNGTGSIGRADLPVNPADPPANVTQSLLTDLDNPQGIAVGVGADSDHLYWGQGDGTSGSCRVHPPAPLCSVVGGAPTRNTIGRANLDGINSDKWFLELRGPVQGIAVDENYIYATQISVAGSRDASLHRWNLSSADPYGDDSSEISIAADTSSDHAEPRGVVVDSGHVYWALAGRDKIARADLDLTNTDFAFVSGIPSPNGLTTEGSYLYWASNPGAAGNPGRDLYRYEPDANGGAGALTDLTSLDSDPSQPNGADVQGVLGASDDANTIYFVANGDLDGGGPAQPGNCARLGSGEDFTGACTLYRYRDGDLTFVARLDTSDDSGGSYDIRGDELNWTQARLEDGYRGQSRTARVSADGDVLLFRSSQQLTAYDSTPATEPDEIAPCGRNGGAPRPCPEFYRYDATGVGGSGAITCVSCNPTGAAPTNLAPTEHSADNPGPSESNIPATFLLRNLSADGNRAFFETAEKLLASDVNGDAACPRFRINTSGSLFVPRCQDVYEWEAEGTGSCHTATIPGGCLYLISTGTSTRPSFFADASADGDHAFIFTRDRLVPSDRDDLQDIYRAGAGSGLASQHAVNEIPCSADNCQGDPTPPPAAPGSGSSTNTGPGNQGKDKTPPSTGTTKSKRCKKGKKGKKCRKARKRNRSANTSRGGSK